MAAKLYAACIRGVMFPICFALFITTALRVLRLRMEKASRCGESFECIE
jgi:hypothetical protein